MKHSVKNKYLERHKQKIAHERGYYNWSEMRLNIEIKECFVLLHEACTNAINEVKKNYENQINALKKTRKEAKRTSLQDEIRRCFPVDRVG